MLVLFETPAGYSLFKVADEKKFQKTDADDLFDKYFSSDVTKAKKILEPVSFEPFQDTADAVVAMTACIEGKVSASLKKFLKKKLKQHGDAVLAVADKGMATSLKENVKNIQVVHNDKTQELFRGIRTYMEELLCSDDSTDKNGVSKDDLRAMQLGLSHSLGRYKLKFSADKVDTMVIQAVGLLDELDKEINTYAMRVKEWYGWHFPELQALVSDNVHYSKLVLKCGLRPQFKNTDLSSILEDESQQNTVKEAAEISMGTEIADVDVIHIQSLAEQVLSMTEYRAQLFDYLKNRMNAIAPNLTILVGELVGARLISHAGSLMNLAKQPASTSNFGCEKALFRALKTKHDTPKYGLIYHASLIGQAPPKHKGKISRVLAAKCALAIRVDALSDDPLDGSPLDTTIGFEGRAKVEARLRQLEGGGVATTPSSGGMTAKKTARYDPVAAKTGASASNYNDASDMVLDTKNSDDEAEETNGDKTPKDKKKKAKKEKKSSEKKKSKKRKADDDDDDSDEKGENGDNKADSEDEAARKAAKKAAKKAKKEKRKSKE
ncbi:Nucleolar protein 58 [Seminavis robusta]|uniref:Nucleolar protein 58 n=2 Tax=Naviculales TaxID=38748 RepID=A0A9N8EIP3_9STRA|nr:Nucleolar protein 58 [Seminavis robusta]|eukprot:Sro1197_g251550.1 Nucleolar protein 58 (550) ;mRNA; r:24683-26448